MWWARIPPDPFSSPEPPACLVEHRHRDCSCNSPFSCRAKTTHTWRFLIRYLDMPEWSTNPFADEDDAFAKPRREASEPPKKLSMFLLTIRVSLSAPSPSLFRACTLSLEKSHLSLQSETLNPWCASHHAYIHDDCTETDRTRSGHSTSSSSHFIPPAASTCTAMTCSSASSRPSRALRVMATPFSLRARVERPTGRGCVRVYSCVHVPLLFLT